jgi:hypothetical protein
VQVTLAVHDDKSHALYLVVTKQSPRAPTAFDSRYKRSGEPRRVSSNRSSYLDILEMWPPLC